MPCFPIRTIALCVALLSGPVLARPVLVPDGVVMLMRHGVRAPLPGEVPADTRAADPWARWTAPPEHLTPHGAAAMAALGRYDRRRLVPAGIADCPAPGTVRIWTNTAERTIASGEAYARGFAPGCALPVGHRAAGEIDAIFEPLRAGATAFDAGRAIASIDAYTGGMDSLVARHRGAIALLDRVLGCAPVGAGCSPGGPARVTPSADGRGIDLSGPIRATSGVAQVLLLEYAEGFPVVAGGRADAGTIRTLGALHAALFDVFTRPPYMAAHQAAVLGEHLLKTLADPAGPRVEILVGHDTNVTALAGALRIDLDAPGYARGDVAPGGALVVTRLRDPKSGTRFVRIAYRAQPLATLRSGGAEVMVTPVAIPGCTTTPQDPCPLDRFATLLRSRIAPAAVSGD